MLEVANIAHQKMIAARSVGTAMERGREDVMVVVAPIAPTAFNLWKALNGRVGFCSLPLKVA